MEEPPNPPIQPKPQLIITILVPQHLNNNALPEVLNHKRNTWDEQKLSESGNS